MVNDYFRFKKFTVRQERCNFKVGTDGVLLGALADIYGEGKLIDVGTGTGLIALMAAQKTQCNIIAIEPDPDSFSQAVENVAASPWAGRINVINCTFRECYVNHNECFDFIISNPPYFRNSLPNPDSQKSLSRHAISLSDDELIEGTMKMLSENGSLHIILPVTEGRYFITKAARKGLFCNKITNIKGVPEGRVIRMIMKFERKERNIEEKFLTIETRRHVYTPEYIEATKDFYLNF